MEEPHLLRKLATVSTFANNFSEQLSECVKWTQLQVVLLYPEQLIIAPNKKT